MQIARRDWLAGAIASCLYPQANAQGAPKMYGLISKLTSVPNRRGELIAILKEGTQQMPGCMSYVIAEDTADENSIWITEVWASQADHDASLTIPAVKESIGKGRPLIASGAKVAVTHPVAGAVPPGR
jgi:quinol monooxygenase YgiN